MNTIISVVTIIICVLIVASNIGYFIYRKIKKMPTGECKYCRINKNKILKEYYKKYNKN